MSLSLDVEKRLGDFRLQVQLKTGDSVLALLGASGCGKTMTLKCIAGIERPDRGRIAVDDGVLFDSEKHIDLTPQRRRTGLLFQNYALFPHMTVEQNILCGTRRDDVKSGRARAEEIMARFGIASLRRHYPHQLSGGQQQRVALGRILVSAPDILLLDEPFSALDSHLRFRLEQEVRGILRDFHKTVILVSHDRDEVFRLSDEIAVMSEGRVEVCGPKAAVFADPQTKAAAVLTGCRNISPLKKLDEHTVFAADWGLTLHTARPVGDAAYVGLPMGDLRPGQGANSFRFAVGEVLENPFSHVVTLRTPGREALLWELDGDRWQALAAPEVQAQLPPEKLLLLKG